MGFAESLMKERKKKGLSQEELAKQLNVTQGLISQYENGTTLPTVFLAVKIAKLFGTTCEKMVEG